MTLANLPAGKMIQSTANRGRVNRRRSSARTLQGSVEVVAFTKASYLDRLKNGVIASYFLRSTG